MSAGIFNQVAGVTVQTCRAHHVVAELPVRSQRAARFKPGLIARMAERPPGKTAQRLRPIAGTLHRQRLKNLSPRQAFYRLPGLIGEEVTQNRVAKIGVFRLAGERRVKGAQVAQHVVAIQLVIEVFTIAQIDQQMFKRQQVHRLTRQTRRVRHQLQQRDFLCIVAKRCPRRKQRE